VLRVKIEDAAPASRRFSNDEGAVKDLTVIITTDEHDQIAIIVSYISVSIPCDFLSSLNFSTYPCLDHGTGLS
jgi:hypothetical protein